ncbi:MAG: molybdopterin molybdotransferase MoeA [Campylobacterota bacterium]|nr:molybdopterin molybdotransferase MoeA [Campylobacterota bacterium]
MAFISYEASKNLLELLDVGMLRSEKIFLSDALGRVLAEDIIADENAPKYPTSAMDGYAVKHADLESGCIKMLGDNPAGSNNKLSVGDGECVKTFTGSVMPDGADTLIQIENVTVDGDTIIIDESVSFGSSVRPVGESYFKDEILIKKGMVIGFAEIGVMAGLNHVMVNVAQKPSVAIVSTGSEILDLGEKATHESQIRSTNNYTIEAIIKMAGAHAIQLGTISDDRASITKGFENALDSADIIISTGGVSVGDYDFVKDIIPRLGAEVIYKGVNIKPGQHIMVAQKGNKFIIALPGFAYSSTVTCILYAIPLIKRFLGLESALNVVEATLKKPFKKRSKKSEFTACNILFEDGKYWVDFDDKKVGTSAILTNMLHGAALMVTGEEDGNLDEGMSVNVILLGSF